MTTRIAGETTRGLRGKEGWRDGAEANEERCTEVWLEVVKEVLGGGGGGGEREIRRRGRQQKTRNRLKERSLEK